MGGPQKTKYILLTKTKRKIAKKKNHKLLGGKKPYKEGYKLNTTRTNVCIF